MAWQPNPGHLPPECEILDEAGEVAGYRSVHVRLFNGWDSKKAGTGAWPAVASRGPSTNWAIRRGNPHPFDIKEWDLA
jgi:hypothetical protein